MIQIAITQAIPIVNSGLSDWEIKLLGRRSSDAYLGYIRVPVLLLADLTKRMKSHYSPQIISPTLLKKNVKGYVISETWAFSPMINKR